MSRNYHVYQVEDLPNKCFNDVHASRIKFFHDGLLDERAIMFHILSSGTGIPVVRLMGLIDDPGGLQVHVH